MKQLEQNLVVTYSRQRARELKRSGSFGPFDEITTLSQFITDTFEKEHFEQTIDNLLGAAIIHHIIQKKKIEYFDYLQSGDESLQTIFDFIVNCHRNGVEFKTLIGKEKLSAIEAIAKEYESFKKNHGLADLADIEKSVLEQYNGSVLEGYTQVYVDSFKVEEIDFVESKLQEKLLGKLTACPIPQEAKRTSKTATLTRPKQEVFDAADEVKTALKIARKLEENEAEEQILIVASEINEYAPLYKLFLQEYGLKGYSSAGVALHTFSNRGNPKVRQLFKQYGLQLEAVKALYGKLGLTPGKTLEEQFMASFRVADEKTGIEMTEPNQLVGLNRSYRHIIFIGTDINHFPPQAKDNFLYTYEQAVKYFYATDYYQSSKTHLNELKRLAENLYIVTAGYSGKRKLAPSILIDKQIEETIDIGDIKSLSELALEKTVVTDTDTQAYYKSLLSPELTKYDGVGVTGVNASHLSASQINKYLACPLAYLFNNKLKLQAPDQPEEGFDVMQQGSLMHLCFELFGKKIKTEKNRSRDREELYNLMHEISIEAYHDDTTEEARPNGENIHHRIFLSTLQAGLKDERDSGVLAKFVDYYIDNAETLNYFQNTEFEAEFLLDANLKPYERKHEKDYGYFIRGFVDRLDVLDNHINIIDYKSKKIGSKGGKHKDTQKKIDTLKDVQLALYMLYAKQCYPNKSLYAALLSFKGASKAAFFGELTDEACDKAYENRLEEIISDTKTQIESGNFGFNNSDEEVCKWCDYKRICHESVLEKVR